MANANAARGLHPIGGISGGPFSGRVTRYYIPATDGTAAYVGGLVKPAGSADANGVMSVTGNVATGNAVIGVIVAVEPVTADSTMHRVASTERYVLVADDPNTLFEVQDDAAAVSAAGDVGNTADLTGFTSGSATTGLSSIQISMASRTAGGDGTEDVIMLGLIERPNNALGANAKWIVRLNNHFLIDAQAGA